MAEFLSTTSKTNSQKGLTELDMAAAQQLMQLSDEDSNNDEKRCSKRDSDDDQSQSEITSALIEAIFGKEDKEVYRPKKRRYRSLVSIYTTTKPVNARFQKKVRSYNNGVLA
ncbi:hypothetical protein RGQ29_022656 [Quercus rubra]|uniref:Uncharacterized protein n=1 Tax=Quercus rubra TaxID=3512 RepID=A0AAN7IPM1_QUERU|nr:hypothetical protein RGQ29_022656 [Quercus rubra]